MKPLSTIFLRMIKSLIAPLIFATLVIGIAGHGDDMKRVGRLALKSLIYFEIVTTLALFIGLAAVNLTRPGVGVNLARRGQGGRAAREAKTQTLGDFLNHIVPDSVFDAAVKNEVLQIVFWSILFGVGLTQVKGRPKEVMLDGLDALAQVMFKFTGLVMKYAPVGIGAAIAVTVGHSGLGVLKNLAMLILTLYAALVVFMLVVLLPVALLARVPLREVRPGGQGAGPDRVLDHLVGGGAAQGDAGDAVDRRAEADRRVRDADRVLVQPRRDDALPGRRVGVRGPGGRDRDDAGSSSS